mmetsp:Transcript_20847/g.61983  ORF Transcript_20847/g.61983 Transcript_20847/m.61983 type:complete len:226 (-) Transcript_20847:189-866(-)
MEWLLQNGWSPPSTRCSGASQARACSCTSTTRVSSALCSATHTRASGRGTLPQPEPRLRRSAASGLTSSIARGGAGCAASAARRAAALPTPAASASCSAANASRPPNVFPARSFGARVLFAFGSRQRTVAPRSERLQTVLPSALKLKPSAVTSSSITWPAFAFHPILSSIHFFGSSGRRTTSAALALHSAVCTITVARLGPHSVTARFGSSFARLRDAAGAASSD